jgi:hypothetical protein
MCHRGWDVRRQRPVRAAVSWWFLRVPRRPRLRDLDRAVRSAARHRLHERCGVRGALLRDKRMPGRADHLRSRPVSDRLLRGVHVRRVRRRLWFRPVPDRLHARRGVRWREHHVRLCDELRSRVHPAGLCEPTLRLRSRRDVQWRMHLRRSVHVQRGHARLWRYRGVRLRVQRQRSALPIAYLHVCQRTECRCTSRPAV